MADTDLQFKSISLRFINVQKILENLFFMS